MSTVTRFAPSPSGDLHLGGARTALFNWLYARSSGGEMLLRIEDTDRERSTQAAVDTILTAMDWLGLHWQQDLYYQSARGEYYRESIARLLEEGHAYYCFCSRERLAAARAAGAHGYDRHCRDLDRRPSDGEHPVVRFKNPLHGEVAFTDRVQGAVAFANHQLDDLIIARADGSPTYNLTVVVDDRDMGITDVIRGDDHLNNTPRQINLFRALGATPPRFTHVPLLLGADGARLSKRHGAAGVPAYRDMGILPEALLNYLVRLGWSHGDRELFSLQEMIELFDIAHIHPAAATFDLDKLRWLNQHYLKTTPPARLGESLAARLAQRGLEVAAGPAPAAVAEVMAARVHTLEEMADKVLYLYADFTDYDPAAARKHLQAGAALPLGAAHTHLAALEDWHLEAIGAALTAVREAHDLPMGKLAQPLRVALSGSAATPPIDTTLQLVGKRRTLARIDKALGFIKAQQA